MQSTFIKIKFTPLIRHLEKDNTKCCLEIVPDVSCIQNIDKIEWNREKLVEYNIPITYKIILKRYKEMEQEKIYYSCIDLRLLSTNSTLACGDVPKVFSDNYILSKVSTDYELNSKAKLSKNLKNQTKEELCLEENVTPVNTTQELCLNPTKEDDGVRDENRILGYKIDNLPNSRSRDIVEGNKLTVGMCTKSVSKEKVTEQDIKVIKEMYTGCTLSKETITDIPDVMCDKEKKLKLTITSVCTLNTLDKPACGSVYDDKMKDNSKIRLNYELKDVIDQKINKVSEYFAIDQSFYTDVENKCLVNNSSRVRILPEIRVANFMMSVENEILPLKIMLNAIYRKCATLGVLWRTNILEKPPPKPCPQYTNKIKFLNYNQTKPKCNRVVYSIVFEE